MTLVTIERAMDHVRADGDDTANMATYLTAAEAACVAVLNRKVYATVEELDDADDDTGIVVTADIQAAILVTVGALWCYRDGTGPGDIPAAALALLRAHRWMPSA